MTIMSLRLKLYVCMYAPHLRPGQEEECVIIAPSENLRCEKSWKLLNYIVAHRQSPCLDVDAIDMCSY